MVILAAACAKVAPPQPEITDLPPLEGGWSRVYIGAGHWKSILPDEDLQGPYRTGPVYKRDKGRDRCLP